MVNGDNLGQPPTHDDAVEKALNELSDNVPSNNVEPQPYDVTSGLAMLPKVRAFSCDRPWERYACCPSVRLPVCPVSVRYGLLTRIRSGVEK